MDKNVLENRIMDLIIDLTDPALRGKVDYRQDLVNVVKACLEWAAAESAKLVAEE